MKINVRNEAWKQDEKNRLEFIAEFFVIFQLLRTEETALAILFYLNVFPVHLTLCWRKICHAVSIQEKA